MKIVRVWTIQIRIVRGLRKGNSLTTLLVAKTKMRKSAGAKVVGGEVKKPKSENLDGIRLLQRRQSKKNKKFSAPWLRIRTRSLIFGASLKVYV